MNIEKIQTLLDELNVESTDIQASALISIDGLMLAYAFSNKIEEDIVAATSAALCALSQRVAKELSRGAIERLFIQGEQGYILMESVDENAVLTVLAKPDAQFGLVFLDMKRSAEKLKAILCPQNA